MLMTLKTPIIIAVAALLIALAGCNTFKGMGKDVEGAGKAIGNAAEKTKEAITK
jgi:predicted small secreted protein